ncbi:MAG TPA: VOC family protein [Steroidobacteraceae bacterium]|nr:VOC family protein [Steroidobacteraceae bacterium]
MAHPSYQGRFIWTELLCHDAASAAAFYARILSWQSQPFSPGSPYLVFSGASGAPIAGNMSLPAEARAMGTVPHWRTYIGASDVDAIVAQASRLGARILEPARDMPGVGRAALLADPEGARFGVFRPLTEASASSTPGEAPFPWYELAARSRETALAFYQQLFGWELRTPMDMGGGFHYQPFGLDGQDFGGCYTIPADRPMPPAWCPYARSSSADEVAGKVVAAGGQLLHGPVDVPNGGRIVQFLDPQHAMFAVVSMAPIAAAKPPAAPKPAAISKPAADAKPARKPKAKPKKRAAKRPAAKPRKAKRKAAKPKARRAAPSKRKPAPKPARKAGRRKPVRRK